MNYLDNVRYIEITTTNKVKLKVLVGKIPWMDKEIMLSVPKGIRKDILWTNFEEYKLREVSKEVVKEIKKDIKRGEYECINDQGIN